MKRQYQHYKVYSSKYGYETGPMIRWYVFRRPKRNPRPIRMIIQFLDLYKGKYIRLDGFSIIIGILQDHAGRQ